MTGPPIANPSQDAVFGRLKALARHSIVYGLFDFLGRSGSLVLVPLYTRALGPSEYGVLELYLVTQAFLLVAACIGLPSAVTRYHLSGESAEARRRYLPAAFWTVTGIALFLAALLAGAAGPVSRWIGGGEEPVLVRLLALNILVESPALVVLAYFRAREQSTRYSLFNLAKLFVSLGVNVWLVGILGWGVRGVLVGNLAGASVAAGLGILFVRRDLGFRPDRRAIHRLLSFGAPLALGSVAFYLLNNADRYFLRYLSAPSELGLYALAYKVAMIMSVTVNAFTLAWPPTLFRVEKLPEARSILGRMPAYYLLAYVPVLLLILAFAPEAVLVAGSSEFGAATSMVGPVAASYLLGGLFNLMCFGVILSHRTILVPVMLGAAVIVNFAGNLLLIPAHGAQGAAWATLIAFTVLVVLAYRVNQTCYGVPYAFGPGIRILVLGGGLAAAVLALSREPSWNSRALRLGVVAAGYPLGILALGILREEEKVRLRRLLRPRRPAR